MKILILFVGMPLVLAAVSCAPSTTVQASRALKEDAHWPLALVNTQRTIRHREQQDFWAANAHYEPVSYVDRVWQIRVYGYYPLNTMGDHVDLLIRDDGHVMAYQPSERHESMVSAR